jgi:hypothetical protein
MSTVLDFFRASPQWNDDLHKILSKIPGYEAQLIPLRQAALGCCGASPGKTGEIKLTVADVSRWDALMAEQATITGKIEAINHMVAELDTIFSEIEAEGIDVPDKTLKGICYAEGAFRTPVKDPETGEITDSRGKKVPEKQDPRFLAWMQRAEKAMSGL